MKHTKGEWTVFDECLCVEGNNQMIVTECASFNPKPHRTPVQSNSERIANSYLIAAAPLLLSALKGLVSEWYASGQDEVEHDPVYERIRTKRIRKAELAIEKAERFKHD